MAVTYTDYQGDIINPALDALMNTEFNSNAPIVETRFYPEFEGDYLARRGEYIRWYSDESEFINGVTNGETREYTYILNYYIDNANRYIKDFYEKVISDRVQRLNKLLIENRTYQPSNVYKWHDAVMETIGKPEKLNETIEDAKDSIYVVEMEFKVTRTNTW